VIRRLVGCYRELGGAEAVRASYASASLGAPADGGTLTLALQNLWQNHRAEAAEDASCLLAECFLESRAAWTRYACRSLAEAVAHGVLSGTASWPVCDAHA